MPSRRTFFAPGKKETVVGTIPVAKEFMVRKSAIGQLRVSATLAWFGKLVHCAEADGLYLG